MKKILSILFILMLIITLVQIRSMYALYKDELSGEYSTSLGKWNVKVNGTDIVSPGNVVSFNIADSNVGYVTGEYVFEGSRGIAPDAEAFFDILIDTQGTEVAVKYEIEIGEILESDVTEDDLVGQITTYRLIDNATGDYIVDDTDGDYEFAIPIPIKFKVLSIEDRFGNYSIKPSTGEIIGTESLETFTTKNAVNDEKNSGIGVIPVSVSQTPDITDKVTIKFKWVSDELTEDDDVDEEEGVDEEDDADNMYKYFAELNSGNKKVEVVVPVKVNAIQYLGEDLKKENK